MRAKRGAVTLENARILVSKIISPRRLRDGGAPMLQAEKMNHQRVIVGNNVISPFLVAILRVWVVS